MNLQRMKLLFDTAAIEEALAAVLDAGLLCDVCTAKRQKQTAIVQRDFCSTCQRVIQAQLGLIVEGRLQLVLAENGLSPDAIKLVSHG